MEPQKYELFDATYNSFKFFFINRSNYSNWELKIINLVSVAHALSLVPHVFFLIIMIQRTLTSKKE